MNTSRLFSEVGELYASTIINEGKSRFPVAKTEAPGIAKGTFKVQKETSVKPAKALGKKAFVQTDSGTEHKGAKQLFTPADPDKVSVEDSENVGIENPKRFSTKNPEYTQNSKKSKKIEEGSINNFMTKSIFDKLYETVMNESDDLNPGEIEAHDAEALDLPVGDEEGEVTITLDKALALKLHDVLKEVLGAHEGEPAGSEAVEGEDASAESEDEEDSEDLAYEATELEELPTSRHAHLHDAKKKPTVDGTWSSHNVDGSEGKGEIEPQNDHEGTSHGHALVNAKSGKPTPVTGKANVIPSRNTKNVGKVAFTK